MPIAAWLLLALLTLVDDPVSDERVVWVDRTQVLAFAVEPTDEDRELTCKVGAPELLEVVRSPRVLAGRDLGFVRLRGLAAGSTRLTVGEATFDVRVRATPVTTETNQVRAAVVNPAEGACLWGQVTVAVEVQAGLHAREIADGSVWLELSTGARLEGRVAVGSPASSPRVLFELEADALPPGPLTLTPVVEPAQGPPHAGNPAHVTVLHPEDGAVVHFECEEPVEGAQVPRLGSHPEASGGGFVHLTRRDRPWSRPVRVERDGRYQLVAVARGTFAAGTFPSLGVHVDGDQAHVVGGRVVDARWRRLAIGVPFPLEAGEHTLGLSFLNPAYLGAVERTPQVDRVELVRLPEGPEALERGGMSMMSMSTVAMITGGMERLEDGAFGGGRLTVAFDRVGHGEPINGRLVVRGSCRYEGGVEAAPTVELLVNGRVRGRQVAARPLFALDPATLEPGENRLRLQARQPDGTASRSPEQTLWLPEFPALEHGRRRELWRFSALDPGWSEFARLEDGDDEPGHVSANMKPGETAVLQLPEELEGEVRVVFEARGPDGGVRARLGSTLVTADGEQVLDPVAFQGWWNHHEGDIVTLARGPKELRIERLDEGEDQRLRLRSLILRAVDRGPDRVAPHARLLWPPDGHAVFAEDVVVLEALDDDRLEGAELVLDGRPMGVAGHVPDGVGHLLVPLSVRDLTPGEHELSVQVTDREGNVGETRTIAFTVLAEPPAEPGRFARAQRLLGRFAYGPGPSELASVLLLGERAWLERELGPFDAGDAAALGAAEARMRGIETYWVARASLVHAIRSPHPARTRLVFWLENHFSTWMRKTQGPSEWREHLRFLRLGAAPFQELLFASATSPAMLTYLDQTRSYAGQLNENYAREILELHTVGVDGGYTQHEVTTLARLLAGLTMAEEALPTGQGGLLMRTLRFDPELSDGRAHEVLGLGLEASSLGERRDRLSLVLEMLAAHPSTARFVSHELARHYVSEPPPAELVDDLAVVFERTGGDLREVLLALAEHPAFWSAELPPRVATPMDYALRIARTTDVHEVDWAVQGYLDRAGMGVFDRATPDGWPEEDEAWTDSNGLLQRWRFVQEVPWALRRLVPDRMRRAPAGDPSGWVQRALDTAAIRLTGATLGEESNAAALAYFEETEGRLGQRLDSTLALLGRLPEANLRR